MVTSPRDLDAAREALVRQRLAGQRGARRPVIPAVDRAGRLPLSFGQERLWFLSQLSPDSTEYQVPIVLRLRGALNLDAIHAAYQQVVDRNEILRTRYQLSDARPVQVIDPPAAVRIPVNDLSGLADDERERQATELARRDMATPFDLSLDSPIRVRVIRIAEADHILAITLHHIAADGWSVNIFVRDFFEFYGAAAAGRQVAMPPPPVQYADYAFWQRDRVNGDLLAGHLAYWREQLAGLGPLELPADRPRRAVREWSGDRVQFTVPPALAGQLRQLAQQRRTTVFVVTLTAFQLLLSRYAGQRDIAVGSALTARNGPGLQDLIGFFLDTIVLRTRWAGDPSFLTLLDRNRQTVLDGISHQEAPLQALVDELGGGRELSRTPLFQVMFDMVEAWPETFCVHGLEAEPLNALGAIAKHDLRLELAEGSDGSLRGSLEYATALFEAATIRRMAGHYLRLLQGIATNPERPVSELELLEGEERRRLLGEGSGGSISRPWRPVADVVAAWARQRPEATALIAGTVRLSYAELDARANQVAHLLLQRGLRPQSVVGVCLERGADLLPVLLGVWRAGCAYTPLDPADPPARLGYILDDCSAELLVTRSGHLDRFPPGAAASLVLVDADRPRIDSQPNTSPARPADPDGLAYLIYTSGSTGHPKGVLVTHRGLMNYLDWAAESYLVTDGAGAPLFSSVAFDLAVTTLYTPLLAGQSVRVLPPDFDLAQLGSLLADGPEGGYSFIKLTPPHLELLCLQLGGAQAAGLAARLVVGGEAFARSLAERWHELAGPDGTHTVNEYGPTEVCVASVAHVGTAAPARRMASSSSQSLPIGRPIPNTTAYVLDDALRPVPTGVVGELYIGGVQLARGYHRMPRLTAERFVPDPYGPPGARLYRTGDLARRHLDGVIDFVGRADEQVKLRGYRIEPAEIVTALRRHPGVRDAAITVHDHGPDGKRLVGYIVSADATPPAHDELRAFAGQIVPAYMVPSAFLTVPAIPLTGNGKVDYRALPEPERDTVRPDNAETRPRNPFERQLATLIGKVLGLDEVGIDDDFFDLGGDSVSAVAVVGALRDDGVDVLVRDIFEYSTVIELAEALSHRPAVARKESRVAPFELVSGEDRAKVPAGAIDAYPMSMLQRGMLYEMLGDGDVHYYHNATTYTIRDDKPFSLPALREAAQLMVQRQEMLRTGFDLTTFSDPLQIVYPTAELPVGVQDLRSLSALQRDQAVRDYMSAQQNSLFDIGKPPLFRLFAHITSDDSWQLTITECHPILEGWGYHLMLMDLLNWYRLIRDGKPVPAYEPLPIRYADFVVAEQRSLASAADRGYWRQIIETVPQFSLPAGWSATPDEPATPCHLQVMFTDIAEDLRALAKAAEVPFKSVMHAAHLKVMSMLTGERAFFTGLVCDTRPEATGADKLPGLFLNTVPFPFRPTARTWLELAQDAFAQETELWPHRRYPVLAARGELGVPSDRGRLIDVLFNYLDFHSVDTERVDFAASVDNSHVEFQLATTVFAQGLLTLRFHPGSLSQHNGARLAAMYRRVLKEMAADPEGDARACYLPAAEHRRLVTDWNDTAVAYPEATLPEIFEEQSRATPDAIAVIAANGHQVTYRELNSRASRLANHLSRLGVGPETRVGLCMDNSIELLVGLLGIVKAGGVYVPLDPHHPLDRLAYVLSDTGAVVTLTQDRLRSRLTGVAPTVVCLDRDWPEIAACPEDYPPPGTEPDNLAYVLYTSGSTGRPKGVMVTHRGLVNYLRWAAKFYGLDGGLGAPWLGSPAVDLAVTNYLVPLACGQAVSILPADGDAAALAEALTGPCDYSLVKLAPVHLELLSNYLAADTRATSVRTVVVGGDRLTGSTASAWRRIAPQARLINEYGPTETVVGCTVFEVPAHADMSRPIPIGTPIANARAYVLDQDLRQVPVGVAGELYIAGAGVARGYLNDPSKTAGAFVPDPHSPIPGARCYRTGDLARFGPDGNLEFMGRIDHQIKFLGYRIEPGEIEARLKDHPNVLDAIVVAREDPPASTRLVAYVVARESGPPELDELREFLSQTLPTYMLPTAAVPLAELPRNQAGKVDRRALPDPAAVSSARPGYVAARSDIERVIAEVWANVLGVQRVGVEDPFTDLGGHSLAAMRVSALLRATHKIPVAPRDVLRYPTVAALAATVAAKMAGGVSGSAMPDSDAAAYRRLTDGQILGRDGALVWFRRSGVKPTLFCVHDSATQCFGGLAEELGPSWPVAAIQHPAMVDPAYAGMPIEDLAKLYAENLRAASPGGRYHLLGWCAGVPVVWELARQLSLGGGKVRVCLLDPKLGDPTDGGSISSLARLRRCEGLIGRLQADPHGPDAAELRHKILDLLRGLFPEGVQAHAVQAGDVDEGWPEVVRTWRKQEQARLDYQFEPLQVPVHLLASDETVHNPGFFSDSMTYDGYLAEWRQLTQRELLVHRIPGLHDGMLWPPLVKQFAQQLATIFDREESMET